MTDGVLLFHSILQLIIAPSSEYSDQPKSGADAQNKPIKHAAIINFNDRLKLLCNFFAFVTDLIALYLNLMKIN